MANTKKSKVDTEPIAEKPKRAPKASVPVVEPAPSIEPTPATPTLVAEKLVAKAPRKFAPDDRIICRSVTSGELIYVGTKSKLYYNWMDYGDTCEVEFQDLQALASMKSRFLVDPLFIIEDEELVEQWTSLLSPIYNRVDVEGIDEIFAMQPKEFENALINAPKGLQNAIRTRAVKMINTQELYDVRKIKAIDKVLGTEFATLLLQ